MAQFDNVSEVNHIICSHDKFNAILTIVDADVFDTSFFEWVHEVDVGD